MGIFRHVDEVPLASQYIGNRCGRGCMDGYHGAVSAEPARVSLLYVAASASPCTRSPSQPALHWVAVEQAKEGADQRDFVMRARVINAHIMDDGLKGSCWVGDERPSARNRVMIGPFALVLAIYIVGTAVSVVSCDVIFIFKVEDAERLGCQPIE